MQKIISVTRLDDYACEMNPKVLAYIKEGQIQSFEGFENYDLLAFDWYDVNYANTATSQILIYLDREDLFFLCADDETLEKVKGLVPENQPNEKALYLFFVQLLKNDMTYLEQFEGEISDAENAALQNSRRNYSEKIMEYRRNLLRLKRYYEQLDSIMVNLVLNDNGLFSDSALRHLTIISNRIERFRNSVLNLRDYVTHIREAYQAQIDIEQNSLMRIFTVVTSVFMPLTLLVGWYGMNFRYMPEISSPYGYPGVIALSLCLSAALLVYFKKKKWF